MIRTQIQLTEEQLERLRRLAAERGISLAELVRQSVDVFVRTQNLVDPEDQRRRALQAAGRFRSGRRDLAGQHDRYLTEAYRK